jgi:hypothetical protein
LFPKFTTGSAKSVQRAIISETLEVSANINYVPNDNCCKSTMDSTDRNIFEYSHYPNVLWTPVDRFIHNNKQLTHHTSYNVETSNAFRHF